MIGAVRLVAFTGERARQVLHEPMVSAKIPIALRHR